MGLMWGLEFVKNKDTKETFDPSLHVYQEVYDTARSKGLLVLPTGGCDKGNAGDLALIGPPLTISKKEIDELVGILDESLTEVEKRLGL